MSRRVLAPVLVSALLILGGCTATTESRVVTDPAITTESTVVTGQEVTLSGRLLGAAVIGIHRVDLPAGLTHEILGQADFQAGHTAALLAGQEGEPLLHTAYLPLGPEPLYGLVYVADLGAAPAEAAGGVIGVALEELQEDSGEVSMSLLLRFDDEAWQGGRPEGRHLAVLEYAS